MLTALVCSAAGGCWAAATDIACGPHFS